MTNLNDFIKWKERQFKKDFTALDPYAGGLPAYTQHPQLLADFLSASIREAVELARKETDMKLEERTCNCNPTVNNLGTFHLFRCPAPIGSQASVHNATLSEVSKKWDEFLQKPE